MRYVRWAKLPTSANGKSASKYANTKTVIDGIIFDSKGEGDLYLHLGMLKRLGEVLYFLRQVPFHLPGGVVYRVDFAVVMKDKTLGIAGELRYLDFKGYETREFKNKKKMVEALYPVEIELVNKVRGRLSGI